MKPSIGRIVHYTLSETDAEQINRRRHDAQSSGLSKDRTGAQIHFGNWATAGEVCPMVITRCWGDTETSAVNGQVLLDGNDTLWVSSVSQGSETRQWFAPPRV